MNPSKLRNLSKTGESKQEKIFRLNFITNEALKIRNYFC